MVAIASLHFLAKVLLKRLQNSFCYHEMMNEILPYVIEEYSVLSDSARKAAAQDRANKDAESWVLERLRCNSLLRPYQVSLRFEALS